MRSKGKSVMQSLDCNGIWPKEKCWIIQQLKKQRRGSLYSSKPGNAVVSYAAPNRNAVFSALQQPINNVSSRTRQTPSPPAIFPTLTQHLSPDSLWQLRLGPALHGDPSHELDFFPLEPQLPLSKLALPKLHALLLTLGRHVLQSRGGETALAFDEGGTVGNRGGNKGFEVHTFDDQSLDTCG